MRPTRPLDKIPRQEPQIPWEVSCEVLTDPKGKNSASFRRPLDKIPRQEPQIPWEVSREVLTNPKAKNSATFRRTMLRSREKVVDYPRKAAKPYEASVAEFVRSRDVYQLVNCLRRYPRRVRALKAWLEKRPVEKLNFIQLQQRNAVELSLVDVQKHLAACELEYNRRIERCP